MPDFLNEDDLNTFEGWLKYQAVDRATATPDDLAMWRDLFDEGRQQSLAAPKVGLMKLQPLVPGEHRYAVAVREISDLWLTLWVRRSRKGEFFILYPRGNGDWNPHASYHLNGTLHMMGFDHKVGEPQKRQPLIGAFRGTEHLGAYGGHNPNGVGAKCDPAAFSGIVEVAPDTLGPRNGTVVIDLVEPGCEPVPFDHVVQQKTFSDLLPWVVIRIVS